MYHREKLFPAILWGLLTVLQQTVAQPAHVIMLANPSFEDARATGRQPSGWFNCGFVNETPPDVQPGSFSVSQPAHHGNTYLGMVVRDNETWEKVGQQLNVPLQRGKCYEMTIHLCHSDSYWSRSQKTQMEANYNTPVVLRVWGGNGYCMLTEKLFETTPVNHTDWRPYLMALSPMMSNYSHITLETYYKPGTLFAYNGNLLSDNLSYIKEIPCPVPTVPLPVASNTRRKRTTPAPVPVATSISTPMPVSSVPATTAKEVNHQPEAAAPLPLPAPSVRKVIIKKELVQTKMLYFEINQYTVPEEYDKYLQDLAIQLKTYFLFVEAGGHTNNNAADKFALELSEKRAKAVADRLIELGVPAERVGFKGYGKTQPMDSNMVEKGREKNQRVEIKVWKTEN
jgi:outer membrane protein OmpA-like peptidoglycan-associated protein